MVSVILSMILLVFGSLRPAARPSAQRGVPDGHDQAARSRVLKAYAALPLSFEENQGQADRSVRFVARVPAHTLLLKPAEALLSLEASGAGSEESGKGRQSSQGKAETRNSKFETRREDDQGSVVRGQSRRTTDNGRRTTDAWLRMKLVNANQNAPAVAMDKLPGKSNYLIGNDPSRWRTGIPNYGKVGFGSVYPGVDVVYYGTQGRLEYDFVVAPKADPRQVLLEFRGGTAVIDRNGDLRVSAGGGEVVFKRPRAYQETPGQDSSRLNVRADYVMVARNRIGFRLSKYDVTKKLIIDPYLVYSTYLGGNQGDAGYAIAIDALDDTYIAGSTSSTNFPTSTTTTPYQGLHKGSSTTGFVTKLDPAGTALVFSTYLGGSGGDTIYGMALDGNGYAYLAGTTSSTDFPTAPTATTTTPGAFEPTYGNGLGATSNAFVAKLDPTGETLVYSSYLGGSKTDLGFAIAVDNLGNAYVTGSTTSPDFPVVRPAYRGGLNGPSDAFVAKVNTTGTSLVYCTYLGGALADSGQGIAVDAAYSAYVTGYTYSSDFPTTPGVYQPGNAGGADAFVAKFNPAGSALVFSTFLGGGGDDKAAGIAIDASSDVYITGSTFSTNFPVSSPSVFQPSYQNNGDAFVAELSLNGTTLAYSTYLGGNALDEGTGIAVDNSGDIWVTGFTESNNFPVEAPVEVYSSSKGTCASLPCPYAFVTELNPRATPQLIFSTYLGGSAGYEYGYGIAVAIDTDSVLKTYVTGITTSSNFPVVAPAYQGTQGDTTGEGDAFVAKISPAAAVAIAITPQTMAFGTQVINTTSAPQVVTLTNVSTEALTITSISAPTEGNFAITVNSCTNGAVIPPSGGTCTFAVVFTPNTLQAVSEEFSIYDGATGSPQTITVTGTGVSPTTTVNFSCGGVTPCTSLLFSSQSLDSTSAPQTITVTNVGTTNLTITAISASGDFAETNNCPASPIPIAPGAACAIFVTFTPTTTGTLTGSIVLTDNGQTSGSQSVSLSGTGVSGYSLTVASPGSPSQILTIGTTSTTFTIQAVYPATYVGTSVALTCASASCSFSNSGTNGTLVLGTTNTSVMTVSGLSSSTANPLNFTVSGSSTSPTQTASLNLTIFFADYTVSATPPLASVAAGSSATYTVTVTPTNGFNSAVLLSCPTGLPASTTCVFSPSAVSLNGIANSTAILTITTTARSAASPLWTHWTGPPGALPILFPLLLTLLLILAMWGYRRSSAEFRVSNFEYRTPRRPAMVFVAALLVVALSSGCNEYISQLIYPAPGTGTPAGNYTITIDGTLGGGGSPVDRTYTVNLAVS